MKPSKPPTEPTTNPAPPGTTFAGFSRQMPRNLPVPRVLDHAATSPATRHRTHLFPPRRLAPLPHVRARSRPRASAHVLPPARPLSGRHGPHCMVLCGAGRSWLLTESPSLGFNTGIGSMRGFGPEVEIFNPSQYRGPARVNPQVFGRQEPTDKSAAFGRIRRQTYKWDEKSTAGNGAPAGDPYGFEVRGLVGYGIDGSGSGLTFGYPRVDPC
ncbi:hypothetical protein C8J57DRAFT_1249740 [Mycena rebaudengoi]|nr:hypothetical protein C8J57DRAFT_1249740 [Mycena rebaudengoi]